MVLSAGAITGITIAVIVVVAAIAVILYFTLRPKSPTPPVVVTCSATQPCPAGYTCSIGGVCIVSPPNQQCSATSPCPTGQVCTTDGQCIVIPPTQPCSATNPCPAGQVCSNGQCAAGPGQQCSATNPCPSGYTCNTQTGQCSLSPSGQTCSTQNPTCPSGQICNTGTGQCMALPAGQCVTGTDCTTDPLRPLCCLQNDGTRRCQTCCLDADCSDPNKMCLNGNCVDKPPVPPPVAKCSSNADCASMGQGYTCNIATGQCVAPLPPTPPPAPQGRSLPWLQLGQNYIVPDPGYASGTLRFKMYAVNSSQSSQISLQMQGDGNLATACTGNTSASGSTIAQFTWGGGFGPNNTSIPTCGIDNQNCLYGGPACSAGQTCVSGKCETLAPGGIFASWVVIGGQKNQATGVVTSDAWLLLPVLTETGQSINFVHLPTGMYVTFQNDGNVVSFGANNAACGALTAKQFQTCVLNPSGSSPCATGTGLNPDTNQITSYCMGGTVQSLTDTSNGLVLPWLQIGTWTIYSLNSGGINNRLVFENTGNSRVTYMMDPSGNVSSYCRSPTGASTILSGSLNAGNNGFPGAVQTCSAAPVPTCTNNQDCGSSGSTICIGGSCLAPPS